MEKQAKLIKRERVLPVMLGYSNNWVPGGIRLNADRRVCGTLRLKADQVGVIICRKRS